MDEVRTQKMEIEVNQDKTDYINYAYYEEIKYWKKRLQRGFQPRAKKNN